MRQVFYSLVSLGALSILTSVVDFPVYCQSYVISYDGTPGYEWTNPTEVILDTDQLSAAFPIGFDFTFFGTVYTEFHISSNGFITFDENAGHGCCTGQVIPDVNNPNNLIATGWEDLNPDGDGWYSYETLGTAPNRKLVVSFYTPTIWYDYLDAQILLYESSNIIEIHTWEFYANFMATQGIENAGGSEAHFHPNRNGEWWETSGGDYIAFLPVFPDDAGIIGNSTIYCEGLQDIKTFIHNYGGNPLTSADVHWQWNASPQTPVPWTGLLNTGESTVVTLGQQTLVFGDQDTLFAWTSLPNGMADPNTSNDLSVSYILPGSQGVFTIGGIDPDFASIQEAIDFLEINGICDSVTFNIRPGTYNTQIEIGYISGAFGDNKIIFQSETGDSTDVVIEFAATHSDTNYVVRLNNAHNIVFKHLTLRALGSFYTHVVEIMNGCSDITIQYCDLQGNPTASVFVDETVIESFGFNERIEILSNRIAYGSYGFNHLGEEIIAEAGPGGEENLTSMRGGGGGSDIFPAGIVIAHNHIEGFRSRGIYSENTQDLTIHHNFLVSDKAGSTGIEVWVDNGAFGIYNNSVILDDGKYGILSAFCNYETSSGLLYNNMIAIAGSQSDARGMRVSSCNNAGIYFNSVLLTNTSATSGAIELASGFGNSVRNNIFVNEGVGYAFRVSSINDNISDNNNLFATGPFLGRSGTTDVPDLSTWTSLTQFDANSLSVPPMFTSNTDLHTLQPQFNKRGTPVAEITTDHDDVLRHPMYPDLGAFEFTPLANDIGVTTFLSPSDTCLGLQDVRVVVKNFGSNQIATYSVEWEVDGVPQTPVMVTNALDTLGGSGNDTAHILLGNLAIGANTLIDFRAWTTEPNGGGDAILLNDTLAFLYRMPLSGNYTIGGIDPDFLTLSEAATTLENFGVCGPVTLLLRDGDYTEQVSFKTINGMSESHRLTITSESADSASVLIQFASASSFVWEFNNTDHVTISHLRFKTLSASNGRIISLTNGANDFVIEYCGFSGSTNISNTFNSENIRSNGASTGIVVRNCSFRLGSEGIRLEGAGTDDPSRVRDVLLENNTFLDHVSEAIEISNGANVTIRNNTVDKHAANTSFSGIALSNVHQGMEIYANNVNISTTGRGISISAINSNDQSVDAHLYNNFVRVSSNAFWQGITVFSTQNTGVYFNNVNNQSTHTGAPAFSLGFGSMVDVKNNCFVSNYGPAFNFSGTFTDHTSDYNNLYSHNGKVGNFTTTTTLEDWQAVTGWDANSVSVNPHYFSDSDLHVFNAALDSAAVPIPSILTDIDNETRNLTHPDIGADEIGTVENDVSPVAILPQKPFESGIQNIHVVVRNYGGNAVSSMDIQWEVEDISQPPFAFTGNLPPLGIDTIEIGQYNFHLGESYSLRAWTELPNGVTDNVPANDSTRVNDLYSAVSGILTIGGTTPDFTTISDAVQTMLAGGVVDSVRFRLRTATYPELISIPHATDFFCGQNVVFESESGDAEDVIWSNQSLSGPPLTLNGADGLTFRNLTFQATSATHGRTVLVQGQSNCNTFDNCHFVGINTTSTSTNLALVISTGDTDTATLFVNNTFIDGSYGIYWQGGSSASTETGTRIEENTFTDQYLRGIYTRYQNAIKIKSNSFTTISTPNNGFFGIRLDNCPNQNVITGNELALRRGTGISVSGCTGTSTSPGLIYNNFVHGGETAATIGINVSTSPHQRVYHNTVRMSGSTVNTWGVYFQSGSSNLHLVNNILDNRAGGVAIRSGAVADLVVSDYNNLLATGTNLVWTNVSTYADLYAWQGTGKDLSSVSVDPEYVSETDLHVTSAFLNDVATPLAVVTTDIDGDLRDPVTPDIGADEFNLFTDDVGLVAINYPAQPFPSGVNTVFIKFINNGADTLTTMQVDWEIDGMPQPTYNWTGLLPSAGIYDSLDIGSYDFTPYETHTIKIWVSNPNGMTDGLSTNDTLEVGGLYPGLLGTYTIGGGTPDFDSLTQAVEALVLGGAAGPVTFNIRAGTYLEPIEISAFPGCGCDTPVIFQSETGDSTDVTITNLGFDNTTITLNSADGVTFQNLTLTSVNPSFRRVIEYYNGAHCNQFLNNRIIGYEGTSSSTNHAVIWSNTSLDTANVFRNNWVRYGAYGFYLIGNTSANSNTIIENNFLDQNYARGIYCSQELGVNVLSNIVHLSNFTSARGVELSGCHGAIRAVGNDIRVPGGQYGLYIPSSVGTAMSRGLIANNFVSVGGAGTAYGIYLNSSTYHDVVHNNINIYSSTASTTNNACLRIDNTTSVAVLNNAVANGSPGYAISASGNSSFSSDYNDLFNTGASLGNWNGAIQADLSAWQTASSADANSHSSNPQFMSDTDLHASNIILNGNATPLGYVTTDIDGEARESTPDIGADEFVPAANDDAGVFMLTGPVAPFAHGSQPVEIALKNFGGNTLTSAIVRWVINGIEQPAFNWAGSLSPAECAFITIGNYNFAEYSDHDLILWAEMPNGEPDSVNVNDTLYIENHYPALNGTYTVGGVLPDFNLFSQLQTALNLGGIVGNVTFDVRNGTYSTQLRIEDFPRVSAAHEVVFQSESGDSSAVTVVRDFSNAQNYTVGLFDAYNISFSRLTLKSTLGRVLDISNGSGRIQIANCRVQGVQTTNTGTNLALVFSSTTSEDSIGFIQNRFELGSYGLYLVGSSGDRETDIVISGNDFHNCRYRSIHVNEHNGLRVDHNSIFNNTITHEGIVLTSAYNTKSVIGNDVRLHQGGNWGLYMHYVSGTSGNPALIANNYILVKGGGVHTHGIYHSYGNYNNFYHNTVRIESTHPDSRTFSDNNSYANIHLRNCSFSNTGGGKTIHNSWATGFHTNTMDYCNLYSTGPVLAYWFNNYATLTELQGATGQNINSVSTNPLFLSDEYHPLQVAMDNEGTPVASVTDDIEGEARSGSTPDIGADEFMSVGDDIGVSLLVSPATYCGLSATENVTIRIQNYGSNAQTGFDVAYSMDGAAWSVQNVGALIVQPGQTLDFVFPSPEDLGAPGAYVFSAYTDLPGDEHPANDTLWDVEVEHIPALTMAVSNMIPVDDAIDLEKTVSLSWAPAQNATRYDVYIWPVGDVQPGTPQISNLTQINTLYSQLNYGGHYNWQVVAENTCDQMVAGPTQQFSVRKLPDLVVDTVIAPSAAFSGQLIEIEWQVRNLGPGGTQSTQWSDAVYLSSDATLNTSFDTYLGAVQNLTALDSGVAYTNTGLFTIPNGFSGNFYVFVHSDRWNSLTEINNNNNWDRTSSTMMITLTPPPDLVVQTIAAPLTTFSGQTINIQYTVENIGLGATNAHSWHDRVFFSADPFNYTGGTVVGTFNHIGDLEPDSTYTRIVSVNVPQGIFGERYVYVVTDWYNTVFENAGEGNNSARSDTIDVILTPPPDLVVYDFAFPDTIHNNEPVLTLYTIENQGGSTINNFNWYDQIYFSQSPIFNTNFLISTGTKYSYGPMAPFEPVLQGHGFTMSKTATGAYFLYIHADKGDAVFEHTFESNNIVRSSGTFVVVNPDIHVDSVYYNSNGEAGSGIVIHARITNDGPGHVLNRSVLLKYYISDEPVFNEEASAEVGIVSYYATSWEAGDTISVSFPVTIPDGISGQHYFYAFADATQQIFENGLESNNVDRGDPINITLPPYPDLLAREITTPDTIAAGEVFTLNYEIANIGSDSINNTSVDSFFLSFNPVWDPASNTPLGRFTGVQSLAAGDSQSVVANLFISPSQTSNFYYVYIKSDATTKIFEDVGESNNIQRSNNIFIKPPLPVDLLADTVYTPVDTVNSGTFLTINWKTTNQGLRIANGIGWFDAIYLSTDTLLNKQLDFRIGEFDFQTSLNPGSSLVSQKSALIPNGFSGDYYLFVYVDDYNSNMDIDQTNNAELLRINGQPHKIHINLSPSPDLTIQNFGAPVSTIAGQPMSVDLTTRNTGTAPASSWQTRLYLSTDPVINGGDILLATEVIITPLPEGQNHNAILNVSIPVTSIGNYILIAQVDAADQVYEHNGENNNIQTRSIEVLLPPPSDLHISSIAIPDSAFAGDTATVSWITQNSGAFPASGMFREVVYFSKDTLLDVTDQIFGLLDDNIYLAPGGNTNRSLNAALNGLARDNYYALVQTDARNNIYESNDTNNITPSPNPLNIDIEQLFLDSLTADLFHNGKQHYFRIEIPVSLAGENLRITIDGDPEAAYNEIYLKYGDVPTLADFDELHLYPFESDQELIFEGLQGGTYYIMCRGYHPGSMTQNVTILARVIDFELVQVAPGKVARNSQATLQLKGTQLDTIRNVFLVRDSTIRIAADTIYVVTSQLAYATFTIDSVPFYDLSEVPLGFYDLQAERWDGKLAELPDAVEVIENGGPADLQFVMDYPATVGRRNGPMKITIFIQNSGDADLVGEHFVFEAPYGNLLSFTYEDLIAGISSTSLEIAVEGAFGPPGILPPKGSKVIEVFAYSRPHPTFALTPVNE